MDANTIEQIKEYDISEYYLALKKIQMIVTRYEIIIQDGSDTTYRFNFDLEETLSLSCGQSCFKNAMFYDYIEEEIYFHEIDYILQVTVSVCCDRKV